MTDPYPISGIILDVDNSILSGATVTAFNETTGEALPTAYQATTNADGEYTIDMSNFSSGYSDEDTIVLYAYYTSSTVSDTREVTYRTAIDVDEGNEDIDLTLDFNDSLSATLWLLSQNWQAGNTRLRTPSFKKIFDVIAPSLMNGDLIAVYERQVQINANGAGIQSREMIYPVSIDIRSADTRPQIILLNKEVDRILNENQLNPFRGFDICETNTSWRDLSDKTKRLWRVVYDVEFVKLNDTRVTEW